ncbi:MAG: enoyl-CoA hydratase/isomerase family protein [Haloarculaceae archaeon]
MTRETGPNECAELTVESGVAELRLADPERRNAFSPALGEDLLSLMLAIDDRDDVSAVVLSSEGEAFCAGLDLTVLQGDDPEERAYMFDLLGAVIDWLYWSDRPIVVGARGAAPGGGSILIDASDIRVAGDDISMWWPEVAFGIPGHHIAARLVSQVGWPRATELMLLGDEAPVGAEEAREIGLVNRVVAPEEVDETAREIAGVIAEHDRQHGNVQSHLEAIHHAREELQGASQAYSRWLSSDLGDVIRR